MASSVLVLGAGIVGVSVALHLQKRGFDVRLIERGQVGRETSYGNAGLIQREGVFPYAFPLKPWLLLKYAFNLTPEANYHLSALPHIAPFLVRYAWNSRASSHARIANMYAPLIMHSVSEHQALADSAQCRDLIREQGWIRLFRTPREMDLRVREALHWHRAFGVHFETLTAGDLQRKEPHLDKSLIGAIHWRDPCSVTDPLKLTQAYLAEFMRLGGSLIKADGLTLDHSGSGWRVHGSDGVHEAQQAVVCLGPWSYLLMRKLGFNLPLAVKRGYSRHYKAMDGVTLNHTVFDSERGYLLAPMQQGIRLTTGAEFARHEAPPTPVQLKKVEPIARSLFPLGEAIEASPWMGSRPCTPDMLPIIGSVPHHQGLWTAFGHGHHGLTLSAVTGRLLSEMMSGETPFADPAPYHVARFL
jgi:D-amino-acid dehydrogenase